MASKKKAKKAAKNPARLKASRASSVKSKARAALPANKRYAAAVKKARKAKGWSQREMAQRLGITQPAVCNVETGNVTAGPGIQLLIQKALKVPAIKVAKASAATAKPAKKAPKKAAKRPAKASRKPKAVAAPAEVESVPEATPDAEAAQ